MGLIRSIGATVDKRRPCKTLGPRDDAMKRNVEYIWCSILFLGFVATARCYTVEKGVSEVQVLQVHCIPVIVQSDIVPTLTHVRGSL